MFLWSVEFWGFRVLIDYSFALRQINYQKMRAMMISFLIILAVWGSINAAEGNYMNRRLDFIPNKTKLFAKFLLCFRS